MIGAILQRLTVREEIADKLNWKSHADAEARRRDGGGKLKPEGRRLERWWFRLACLALRPATGNESMINEL